MNEICMHENIGHVLMRNMFAHSCTAFDLMKVVSQYDLKFSRQSSISGIVMVSNEEHSMTGQQEREDMMRP
jgi:hypothetical protein